MSAAGNLLTGHPQQASLQEDNSSQHIVQNIQLGAKEKTKLNWKSHLPFSAKEFVGLQKVLDPLLAGGLFLQITALFGGAVHDSLMQFAFIAIIVLSALFLSDSKVYEGYRKSRLWSLLSRLTEAWAKVVFSLIIIGYFAKVSSMFSRLGFIAWALLGWLLLVSLHIGSQKLLRYLRSHGVNNQDIVFLGSRDSAVKFFQQISELPYLGLNLKAWFSVGVDSMLSSLPPRMPEPSGEIEILEDWLITNHADQIHFCSSDFSDQDISMEALVAMLGNTSLPVFYIPNWVSPGMRFHVEQLGGLTLVELWGKEDMKIKLRLKRFFDVLGSLLLIALLSPVFILLAILVMSNSPGPVIYCQNRYGLDGECFKIFKFRTMSVIESGEQIGLQQARRNDSRVTSIGRIMRRWSLDELPQLVNVLNGSMSLVGPRPHAVAHNEEYRNLIVGYMQRHQLRPGITGLAQVKGFRGETAQLSTMKRRVEADLQYLKEWSFLLDIEILIKTIFSLRSPNAY